MPEFVIRVFLTCCRRNHCAAHQQAEPLPQPMNRDVEQVRCQTKNHSSFLEWDQPFSQSPRQNQIPSSKFLAVV